MFNLGFLEIVAIGVIALIVVGPKQLPGLAKSLGKMIREFKKATGELSGGLLEMKDEIQNSIKEPIKDNHTKSEKEQPSEPSIDPEDDTTPLDDNHDGEHGKKQ